MGEWDLAVYALVSLSLMLGGLSKGFTGIGLPLISVPLMGLWIDLPLAVALMPIPILVTNIWQTASSRHVVGALRRFWPLLATAPVGVVLGVKVLATADPQVLRGLIGSILLGFVLLMYFQPDWQLSERAGRILGPFVGFVAGLVGGIASFFAPPLLVFLVALRLPKDEFVGTIGLMYLFGVVPMIASLVIFEVLQPRELIWSAMATIPVFAGQLIGHLLRGRISEGPFRRLVLVLMLVTGVNLLRQAFL